MKNERKVGVISYITYSSHLNYGATLHGYAFQYLLRSKYGIDSSIIKYIPKTIQNENLKYPLLNPWKTTTWNHLFNRGLLGGVKVLISNMLRSVNWMLQIRSNVIKYNKFQNFINSILQTTIKTYSYDSLQKAKDIDGHKYCMFIVESDVIWKIRSINDIDENFFLSFPAAKDHIKIAYAPAISRIEMSGNVIKRFIELTKTFNAVSTRDKEASDYLQRLLQRECPYVLDPTLLLEEEDYDIITTYPEKYDNYLLIYNCTVNDIKMVREACRFAKLKNLKVIEVSNYAINRFFVNHKVINNAGIEEWLGWFKKARYVVTNSFHGICFSIIFKKDFYVYQRDNSDFRFTDILKNLGLRKALITFDKKDTRLEDIKIDYTQVYQKLNDLRQVSEQYIKESIVLKLQNIDV